MTDKENSSFDPTNLITELTVVNDFTREEAGNGGRSNNMAYRLVNQAFRDNGGVLIFYNPACPHCHNFKPAARELASKLNGVVPVGAINVEDFGMGNNLLADAIKLDGVPRIVFAKDDRFEYYKAGDRNPDNIIRGLCETKGICDSQTARALGLTTEMLKHGGKRRKRKAKKSKKKSKSRSRKRKSKSRSKSRSRRRKRSRSQSGGKRKKKRSSKSRSRKRKSKRKTKSRRRRRRRQSGGSIYGADGRYPYSTAARIGVGSEPVDYPFQVNDFGGASHHEKTGSTWTGIGGRPAGPGFLGDTQFVSGTDAAGGRVGVTYEPVDLPYSRTAQFLAGEGGYGDLPNYIGGRTSKAMHKYKKKESSLAHTGGDCGCVDTMAGGRRRRRKKKSKSVSKKRRKSRSKSKSKSRRRRGVKSAGGMHGGRRRRRKSKSKSKSKSKKSKSKRRRRRRSRSRGGLTPAAWMTSLA